MDKIIFHAQVTNIPRDSGGGTKILNLAEDIRTKWSTTQIKNSDNLYAPRAVVVTVYFQNDPQIFNKLYLYNDELSTNSFWNIIEGRTLQSTSKNNLCNKLESYNEDGFTLEDIKKLETLLNIDVKIICSENFNAVLTCWFTERFSITSV